MDHLIPRPDLYGVPFKVDDFNGMPYRWLGRSGLKVSAVGVGLWKIGFPETGDGARVGEWAAYAILDRALELGVTFWDTANRYNNASGNSERLIGRWFRANEGERRNIVLATKVCGGMDGRSPNHGGLSRGNILDSVRTCLDRLQTDRIDLLYFHRFDPSVPAEESLSAVDDLVRQDLVRYFAVSNFTVDNLDLYRRLEADFGVRCRVQAVQNRFDILHGEGDRCPGVLEYAARAGLSFVAYGPLARGLLTARYLDPTKGGPGDRLYDEGTLDRDTAGPVRDRLLRLAALAREWDLELSQLALAYLMTLPGMGPPIPSASSVEQLESNAAAGRLQLTDDQRARVRAVLET